MCGRFLFLDGEGIAEIGAILRDIGVKYSGTGLSAKTGEIFPTDSVAALSLKDGKPALSLMKWGFPKWSGEKGVIINARSETAAEKKMFAKPLAERRCVIPSTGFLEWKRSASGKSSEKFRFNMADELTPMLYMAGIYTEVDDGDGVRERFVILTREANASIAEVHDRMPVILHKSELTKWLSDRNFADYAMERDDVELLKQSE
ncbi:DUF159 family protein [Bacteroidia bacterium]|nr:DUF159 family protein [Bacteroidia bacterium]